MQPYRCSDPNIARIPLFHNSRSLPHNLVSANSNLTTYYSPSTIIGVNHSLRSSPELGKHGQDRSHQSWGDIQQHRFRNSSYKNDDRAFHTTKLPLELLPPAHLLTNQSNFTIQRSYHASRVSAMSFKDLNSDFPRGQTIRLRRDVWRRIQVSKEHRDHGCISSRH